MYRWGGLAAGSPGAFQNTVTVTKLVVVVGPAIDCTVTDGGFAEAPGSVAMTVPAAGAGMLPAHATYCAPAVLLLKLFCNAAADLSLTHILPMS